MPTEISAFSLLKRFLLHFCVLALPYAAACIWGAGKGIQNRALLVLLGLCSIAATGYVAFWVYFASAAAGSWFSVLSIIAVSALGIIGLRRLDPDGRRLLKKPLSALALSGIAAMLIISSGFLHGGLKTPLETPRSRFSHMLPPDNVIPYLFAAGLWNGSVPRPLLAEWQSSDRPPLQSGIVVWHHPFMSGDTALDYLVISVIAQCLFIAALWAMLSVFDIDRRAISLAIAAVLFSGFTFLNAFYVWPKLFAAAYVLGFAALVFGSRTLDAFQAALAGCCAAFAMLAHGGSAFALAAIVAIVLLRRVVVPWRSFAAFAAAAAALFVPWSLYQKFFDPPGDRLLKWHLAGVILPDERTFAQALVDEYSRIGWSGAIGHKLQNVRTVAGHPMVYLSDWVRTLTKPAETKQAAAQLRHQMFFEPFAVLGPMALAPLFLLFWRRRNHPEYRAGAWIWLCAGITLAGWCLLMFGPGTTTVHTGAYAYVVMAYAGSALALWAASPLLAYVVTACSAFSQFLIFEALNRPEGTNTDGAMVAAIAIALVLTCVLLWRLSVSETDAAVIACPKRNKHSSGRKANHRSVRSSNRRK